MRPGLLELFQETYAELRPGTALPEFKIEFFAFANVNNTIRLRDGRLLVRLSDLLEGAPLTVLKAIAHILLAKMYRRPIDRGQAARYRKYVASHEIVRKAHLVRQMRGRKLLRSPRGHFYDLDAIFEDLNRRFFHGLMARPRMSWSQRKTRRVLGHYDPAHNAIIISRIFDHSAMPRYVLEYIVYHEMLHLKHPVKLRGSRRCVHSPEFQAEEKLFPGVADANAFLKRL
ncbi:MAG TPA: SprT-like domain-containing protein [Candidatus Sulfotelmatobacter sp.]|nr:SprT-like domain-containing protein [Candidatus Sulfotelmatobacter sp.]